MAKAEQFPRPLSEQGKTAQDRLVDISVDINTRLEHIAGLLGGTERKLTDREKIAIEWQMIGAAAQVLQVPNPPDDLGNNQKWNSLHKMALRQIAESIMQIDKLKSEQKS